MKLIEKIKSAQGVGCLEWSRLYDDAIDDYTVYSLMKLALSNGVNFFDTADVYGFGLNEIQISKALSKLISQGVSSREEIVIGTKCGRVYNSNDTSVHDINNSYSYVTKMCNASLMRLGGNIDYIDLFYLHRVNENQLNESMYAMSQLLKGGKIQSVGLSEISVDILDAANRLLKKHTNGAQHIAAVQSEYSLLSREVETNGVLDYCKENNIAFIAYSPLCRGLLTDKISTADSLTHNDFRRKLPIFHEDNIKANIEIVELVKLISDKKKCSVSQVALSWLKSQGAIAIPGTSSTKNLLSNIKSLDIKLSEKDLSFLSNLPSAKVYPYS